MPSPDTLAEPIATGPSQNADAWFYLAQAHADLAGLADSAAHADATLSSLRRAIELGFQRGDRVDSTAQFDSVRDRSEFQALRALMNEVGK